MAKQDNFKQKFSLRSNLTWFLSSSLHSISCVYFFCTVHTTIMILAYFNPHNPQLAGDDGVTIHGRGRSMTISMNP